MKCTKSAVLLLALLVAASTFSCGETAAPVTTDAVTTTAPATETEADKINWESSGLPEKDFEGKEFTILMTNVDNLAHTWHLIAPEELSGDTLNDAMYDRNKKIEDIYNITITGLMSTSVKNDANNAINAGDNTYDAIFTSIYDTYGMAQEGKFYNFYNLPYTDPTAEWWDQSLIRDLTYHDSLYHLTGDISPSTDSRVYTIVFNKDLCSDLGLEMPYQYVLDGSWTIDRFNEYISDVNNDLNGDGQMNYDDRWGFMSQDGASWMMYFAGGGRVVEKDANGDLSIAFNTERNIELATKGLEIAIDESKTLMANQYVTDHNNDWAAATSWFAAGGSLFRSSVLEPIPRDLRSLDVNFGIVPFPKLDENQDQYYTLAEEYSRVFSVPVTADAECSSLILEALSAESVSTVTPAFYDVVLDGKAVRDEESKEMLDIIFANKVFDIGFLGNVANFKTMMLNLEKQDSTNVTSQFASVLSSAEAALEKICENFDGIQ